MKVKVKVKGQFFLYEWEALVRGNLHAKYEGLKMLNRNEICSTRGQEA